MAACECCANVAGAESDTLADGFYKVHDAPRSTDSGSPTLLAGVPTSVQVVRLICPVCASAYLSLRALKTPSAYRCAVRLRPHAPAPLQCVAAITAHAAAALPEGASALLGRLASAAPAPVSTLLRRAAPRVAEALRRARSPPAPPGTRGGAAASPGSPCRARPQRWGRRCRTRA